MHGGNGNDTLRGDDGSDTFFFDAALDPATNVDTILDFEHKIDTIALSLTIFTGISGAAGDTLSKGAVLCRQEGPRQQRPHHLQREERQAVLRRQRQYKGHKELIAILDKHLHLNHDDFELVA